MPILLRILEIYLVAGLGILTGIGIAADARRWFERRQDSGQGVCESFERGHS